MGGKILPLAVFLALAFAAPVFSLDKSPGGRAPGDRCLFPTIPFGSQFGGISVIRGARLVVSSLPYWADLDAGASSMGPVDITPGQTARFTAVYVINDRFRRQDAAAEVSLSVVTDSPQFVPAGVTWRFVTDNGFLTMRGECADNSGAPCGIFTSPDMAPPETELEFGGDSVRDRAGEWYVPEGSAPRLESREAYVSNSKISGVQVTRYSVDNVAVKFFALGYSGTDPRLTLGRHRLYYAAMDYAGNEEAVRVATVTVVTAAEFEERKAEINGAWPVSVGRRILRRVRGWIDFWRS